MSKIKRFKKRYIQQDGSWSSISDLMSGLMIIFLFIGVSFMSKVADESISIKNQQNAIGEVISTYENTKEGIYNDLYFEFKDDMKKWNMEIDTNGTIRFTEPEVFFNKGDSEVKAEFKEILETFFPRYIGRIYKNHKDNIKEIRIEGHTSSEWDKDSKKIQSYFANMELSQDRTRKVLEYVMSLPDINQYEDWLIDTMTANGMSYSKRIYKEDKTEDYAKSRRVEFKVITNADETINNIVEKYKE